MNEKTLRALVEAGAVKRVRIIADGARFHVEADTPTATVVAATSKGSRGRSHFGSEVAASILSSSSYECR